MSEGNGNGQEIDFADPAFKSRMKKSKSLVTCLTILNKMVNGAMKGDEASRLETDPDTVSKEIIEFVSFMATDIASHDLPTDWKSIFKVEPVRAPELIDFIDAPIPYIVKPLIVEGSLTQIQGIPKGGKSAFSVYLALCLSTGTWPFPHHFAAADPVEVLYLAWEDPKIMMAKRLSLYAAGLGFDRTFLPEKLTFLFAPDLFIEQADHEKALRAAIAELKPKVIFVDTLSHIHGAEENSSSEMKIPMKALARVAKDTGIGIVYIHHTGKGSGEKLTHEKSRGSGAIAAAWHVLIDWGVRDEGSNVNPVEVQSKYESKWKKLAIAYQVEPDEFGNERAIKWQIDAQETGTKHEPGSGDKRQDRILETFQKALPLKEWLTAKELANLSNLGLDEKSIRRHLNAMCLREAVESRYTGPRDPLHYRLAPSKGNLS